MKASPRLPFSIMNMPTFPKVPLLFFKMEHVGVFFLVRRCALFVVLVCEIMCRQMQTIADRLNQK